jgi:hypothetical protein
MHPYSGSGIYSANTLIMWDSVPTYAYKYMWFMTPSSLTNYYERSESHCFQYSSAPLSEGNKFQDLPWLRETVDNTDCYI